MIKTRQLVISAFLAFTLQLACQADTNDISPSLVKAGLYSFELKNADIRDAVTALRSKLSIPVCFEMEDLDPGTQGITARERASAMKTDGTDPSAAAMMEDIAKDHPNSIVDWKLPRYNFKFENANVTDIVSTILKKYQSYNYRFDNTYLVVCPKSSILDFSIGNVTLSNKKLGEAIEEVMPTLQKKNISIAGPIGAMQSSPDPLISKISEINLDNVSAGVYLTRLCQASQPLTVWSLVGMKGSRLLTFTSVESK